MGKGKYRPGAKFTVISGEHKNRRGEITHLIQWKKADIRPSSPPNLKESVPVIFDDGITAFVKKNDLALDGKVSNEEDSN